MNNAEEEIRYTKRRILNHNNELTLLEQDVKNVRSLVSRELIEKQIRITKNSLERLEFKLWKLENS